MLIIAMTPMHVLIRVMGLLDREKHGIAGIGWESFLIIVLFIGGYALIIFSDSSERGNYLSRKIFPAVYQSFFQTIQEERVAIPVCPRHKQNWMLHMGIDFNFTAFTAPFMCHRLSVREIE